MTKLMYMEYPDLFESSAKITNYGYDDKGVYLLLNQSIFYPQGGGQPADQGMIIHENVSYKVVDVRNISGDIRHYIINNDQAIDLGSSVITKVDKNRRIINSKYHTAGHLIAAVIEKTRPEIKAIKGHQFPGEAFIEFEGYLNDEKDFIAKIIVNIKQAIKDNYSVKTAELNLEDMNISNEAFNDHILKGKPPRVCNISGFSPVPCGGTHVKTLAEISDLEIKKYKVKQGKIKIYYEV